MSIKNSCAAVYGIFKNNYAAYKLSKDKDNMPILSDKQYESLSALILEHISGYSICIKPIKQWVDAIKKFDVLKSFMTYSVNQVDDKDTPLNNDSIGIIETNYDNVYSMMLDLAAFIADVEIFNTFPLVFNTNINLELNPIDFKMEYIMDGKTKTIQYSKDTEIFNIFKESIVSFDYDDPPARSNFSPCGLPSSSYYFIHSTNLNTYQKYFNINQIICDKETDGEILCIESNTVSHANINHSEVNVYLFILLKYCNGLKISPLGKPLLLQDIHVKNAGNENNIIPYAFNNEY